MIQRVEEKAVVYDLLKNMSFNNNKKQRNKKPWFITISQVKIPKPFCGRMKLIILDQGGATERFESEIELKKVLIVV